MLSCRVHKIKWFLEYISRGGLNAREPLEIVQNSVNDFLNTLAHGFLSSKAGGVTYLVLDLNKTEARGQETGERIISGFRQLRGTRQPKAKDRSSCSDRGNLAAFQLICPNALRVARMPVI
jgi:hypothetical protein